MALVEKVAPAGLAARVVQERPAAGAVAPAMVQAALAVESDNRAVTRMKN